MLRIIGGEQRGRKIEIPPGGGVRPTTDRVREAIFNMLRQLVPGRAAFDLFAGSGALGLEALSRGADRVTFVESDTRVAATLRHNIKHLHYDHRATIVTTDVFRWADRFVGWPKDPAIVLIAPPYIMFDRRLAELQELWMTLLDRLPEDTAIAMQAPQHFERASLPAGADWELRRYGSTQVVIGQTQKKNAELLSRRAEMSPAQPLNIQSAGGIPARQEAQTTESGGLDTHDSTTTSNPA